jgi:hypothetical protein
MEYNKFDQAYYVMNVDGANNRPLLAWGKVDFASFLKAELVDESSYDLPLNIIFDEPYPKQYEIADLLTLSTLFAVSEKFKNLFEKLGLYGVQFIPIEIKSNKGDIIKGHYVAHVWNKLSAIDKINYIGDVPNRFESIRSLEKFSLDANLLESIPLEKRLVFGLAEKKTLILVRENVYEAIQAENLTGIRFLRVDKWNDNAAFI